jgi:hypothetical protein
MSNGKGGEGLRGRDRQQAHLRDTRAGAYDAADPEVERNDADAQRSRHRREQPGAEVRQEVGDDDAAAHTRDDDLPEGLKRKPTPPYDKDAGRGD